MADRTTELPVVGDSNQSLINNITDDLPLWEENLFIGTIFLFDKCLPPVLIAIGLVGNLLAFLVPRRPKYYKQSTCVYMRALTFFDSFTLIFYILQRYLLHMFPDQFWSMGSFFCKEFIFIAYFALSTSHWAIVLMTIDRFIAVRFPLRSATLCTTNRAKTYIVVMTLMFAAFHFQHFWRKDDVTGNVLKYKCPYDYEVIKPEYEIIYQHLFVNIVMVGPLLIVFVLNIWIVVTVRNSHRKQREMGMRQGQNGRRFGTDKQITFMLLLVSWVFTLTVIPFTLDHFVWDVGLDVDATTTSKRMLLLRAMLYEVAMNVLAINPACNFYMYCLGCKKFRMNLKQLFLCRKRRSSARHYTVNGLDMAETASALDSNFTLNAH